MERCGSCAYFCKLAGQCRRNPPAVFPMMAAPGQLQFVGTFPPVKESDWCGAHKMDLSPGD